MSGFHPTAVATSGSHAIPLRALAVAGPLWAWAWACVERTRQRHALSRLDDRLLRDVGLSRSDVDAEQAKWVWRR